MSCLLTAELRKVWGNRVFPMLLAVLVAAPICYLLWMGTRPTANQPPAVAYRAGGGLIWLPGVQTWRPRATFFMESSTKPNRCCGSKTTTVTSPTATA